VKIFTQQIPFDPAGRAVADTMPLKPGVWSVRFGSEKLMFSDEPPAPKAPGRGARIPSRDADVSPEQLHIVVQNGRLFQQHHPEVPVLHDRGRFLLVKLDPRDARKLAKEAETCYGVMPLAGEQVVFDEPAPAARAPVAFVKALADRVQRASVEASLKKLVSFKTRHSTSTTFSKAVTWARKQMKDMGYTTRLQTITVSGKSSRNIIAEKAGSGSGKRNVIMATAHLDSVNLKDGPAAPAPGADDNGSGSAGLLEIARALQSHHGVHDLRLVLFGGEEQGLFGSKQYVAGLSAAERSRIKAVVNMDMIGSVNTPVRSVLLEGAALSQTMIDKLSEAAATYTQLKVETSLHPFNSDHVPFIDAGIPSVLTIEGADNTNDRVHSANDTIDKVDYDLMVEILRMNVAFLADQIGAAPA